MGWYLLPEKGSKSYCLEECKHLDCVSTRTMMRLGCPTCGKPFEGGERVYFMKDSEGRHRAEHAFCVEHGGPESKNAVG